MPSILISPLLAADFVRPLLKVLNKAWKATDVVWSSRPGKRGEGQAENVGRESRGNEEGSWRKAVASRFHESLHFLADICLR